MHSSQGPVIQGFCVDILDAFGDLIDVELLIESGLTLFSSTMQPIWMFQQFMKYASEVGNIAGLHNQPEP